MAGHPTIDELDDIVSEHFTDDGPGVAVAAILKGKVVHARGYGLANVDKETPISTATVFDLASVSKQITATAILLLASRGKLDIDAKIGAYLRDYKLKPKGRDVLVRDLLHHLSGLADYTGDEWEGSDEEFKNLTNKAHVRWINGTRPLRAPGKRYEYNNSGYALLASIVEEVSGQSYSSFVKQNLFEPLGMSSTVAFDDLSLSIPRRATGYKDEEPVEEPSVIQGDGNIFSSLEDMILWDRSLREATLLDKKWLKKAWTNGALDGGRLIDDGEGSGYGFGWCIEDQTGAVSHSGSWSGTATNIIRYLGADLTVIALSNDEDTDVDSICRAIGAHFGAEKEGWDDEDEDDDDEDDDDEDDDDEDDEDDEDDDDDDDEDDE